MKFKLKEVTKKRINQNYNVYDLTVENNHTYCVENTIVHNCGFPQLSACLENAYVAHGLQNGPKRLGLIVSDGGHKTVGDVCKALCAGSDFVMLGGYFAGSDSCDGEWEYEYRSRLIRFDDVDKYKDTIDWWQPLDPGYETDKRKTKFTYYGMSTHYAQEKYEDQLKNYRASEGTKITVNYKGSTDKILQELLGGIRSCCCYIGSNNIKHMSRCGQFCKVSNIHSNNNPVFGV